jgi:FHA domain
MSPNTAAANDSSWSLGGPQFTNVRTEVYTRSLYRLCLKFTTSEDEDEGKPEPATAFWTMYGRTTTIGNGTPTSPAPDTICRRMDDSMSGPAAGILARLSDQDGSAAAVLALRAGFTTGWHVRGDRGDTAVRVGKAKVVTVSTRKEAQILSLDADRWMLIPGASFAAGNSVFSVEQVADNKLQLHCAKGPLRGKLLEIRATACPYVFGRAHEADLCIMDRELSRRHGAILYLRQNQAFCLVDLESTVRCCGLSWAAAVDAFSFAHASFF